jgi:RNA polymerase sigma-70 factor (ECF subfamily)
LADDPSQILPLSAALPGWNELLQAAGPALLVVIHHRMRISLQRRVEPEDVLQEALLHAWRDRAQFQWRGPKSFRSWVLTVIDHRIRDLVRYFEAEGRSTDRPVLSIGGGADTAGGELPPEVAESTTPSRLGAHREQSEHMRAALEGLPDELRHVVYLRLFEQRTFVDVAAQLGIGEQAARSRFRKGSEVYRRRLRTLVSSHWTEPQKIATDRVDESASGGGVPSV